MVREVQNQQDFDSALKEAGDKLVVVDFTASWCGPCRAIAPKFEALSETHKDEVVFLKVDVDKCKDVSRSQGISAMPTFKFFKQGKLYDGFLGGDLSKLETGLKKYSQKDAEPNPNAEASLKGGAIGCLIL
mmetsp:Transcript_19348/g.28635  ORF Transcript_19348/g.28635 Transcript_19348/m.28635 type:complete len:131 (-) Transcript_19348:215-607(-)|eukprot:CAMPEP_0194254148 /NCGR_PEP_ID=MMETSP0158-20130606/31469_1 /TAXON_ID=33649 /ORGANISM="Thalassionema nitzschioides, Strain L26-B" /LENGTH=130 /DNA_ID=CAMNT_0038992073 /DNA_START=14 /DNA_END=406 /DNA_ORIENTATION=+